jgi:hypothetical protein
MRYAWRGSWGVGWGSSTVSGGGRLGAAYVGTARTARVIKIISVYLARFFARYPVRYNRISAPILNRPSLADRGTRLRAGTDSRVHLNRRDR